MEVLRAGSLLAATLSMGLVAGVFALYAHTIMPGLGRTDDRTFVGAFQAIDRAIINPWFIGGGLFGALVCTIVAAIAQLGRDGLRSAYSLPGAPVGVGWSRPASWSRVIATSLPEPGSRPQ